jgi:DNA polymerase II large subunit
MGETYFEMLKSELHKAYSVATEARRKGYDPSDEIEVRIAKDVAARVEGIVGPPGVSEHIRSMEKSGMAREDIAFEIAHKIAAGELLKANKEFLIEQAVRTGLGILTEGVLVAPTEGIARVKIKQNPDGSDYVAVYFAGPIRSAGGTAAALSLVLADIARRVCGISEYRATDTQTMRYVEEVNTYETRCVHLQYLPPEEHMKVIAQNVPICIDGDPTEDVEVSAYRDVPGVETNRVRGGVPLVMCEGVALKAAKLLKYTKRLNLGWGWLEKIIKIKKKADRIEIKPDNSYLEGLVAGRPVFAYPSRKGGFRLRYGRSNTNGLMAKNIHPATMVLLDNFLAFGTHMKIERPGKGCVVAAHEGLEPPVVKLNDGRVMKVRTLREAEAVKEDVAEILFIGDMLCNYGDFLKSNHPLIPGGYCEEWWERELEAKGLKPPENMHAAALFDFSRKHGVSLHPEYTYHWHDLSAEQLKELALWLRKGHPVMDEGRVKELVLPQSEAKRVLEELLVEHRVHEGNVVVSGDDAYALLSSLDALKEGRIDFSRFDAGWESSKDPLEFVNGLAGIRIKAKAPTYVGARMGRPEKAKERKMDGSPQVLFPTGSFKNRSIMKHYRVLKGREGEKTINLELTRFRCGKCGKLGFYRRCDVCGSRAVEERICQECGRSVKSDIHCDRKTLPYDRRPVDIVSMVDSLRGRLDGAPEDLKGVKGLSNALRIPERLEKGFLRAKHDVYVFRDGTSRFDASDVTLSHFRPKDIGMSLERLRELGYERDYLGNRLERDDQTLALRHQDIVLSEAGAVYLMRVADFIDDMLVNVYGMRPFYNIRKKEDLIGHLTVGLSPHTSAGVLTRVIGFTKANVGYGHPYFHTAKRRNCFYRDTEIIIWDKINQRYLKEELGSLTERVMLENPGKVRQLDKNTQRIDAPKGLFAFGIDSKSHNMILKKIKYFIKSHPSNEWLKITTTTNRSLTVTPDHNILFVKDGNLQVAEAKNIGEGANLPVCLKLDSPKSEVADLNLAEAFSELEPQEKNVVMLRAKSYFKDLFYQNRDLLCEILPLREYEKKSPIQWYRSVPLSHFEIMMRHGLCTYGDLPEDTRVAMKRDDMSLPLRIAIDEDLMLIFGYYVAEGYGRESKSCYQVNFRICNKQMLKKLLKAIKNIFGKKPYLSENNTQIAVCSRLIYLLFKKIFKTGTSAKNKRIPNIIFSLHDDLIRSFISAYFDGDGSVVASPPRIHFYSVSQKLLDDIGTLLLRFGILCRYGKNKHRMPGKKLLERYRQLGTTPKTTSLGFISLYGKDQRKFAKLCSSSITHKEERLAHLRSKGYETSTRYLQYRGRRIPIVPQSDYVYDKVKSIESFTENTSAYCLDVEGDSLPERNVLLNNQIVTVRCDGDEDSVMLLMDALINFSRRYLDERRGGTMDAPLVLTIEVNPKEVDDEAHCIEFVSQYPLEFYEAAERFTPPGDIKIKTVKDVLGTPEQFEIPLTHPGGSLDEGNTRTAYVELESIPEKIDVQFRLQERLRPVDIRDAAERLILSHFIPDLYGNLRSFSRQTFRCVSCNTIYRRVPLAGKCSRCGGNLLLTINKGGIEKYLQISRDIVQRYELPLYLKQRLDLLEKEIQSIFEDDKIKQTGLSDFL